MKDQYTFHVRPDLGEIKAEGAKTTASLPQGAGYGRMEFAADVLGSFYPDEYVRTRERADIEDVQETWEDHVLYKGNQFGGNYVSLGEARDSCEAFNEVFNRIEKSALKEGLLKFTGGDTRQAAQMFVDWCEQHVMRKGQMTPTQFAESILNGMDKLEEVMQTPAGKSMFGTDSNVTPEKMRVLELLPKVRKKYEFASVKSYVYEESFFPDDDIDVRNMQSYGEIMRIPKTQLGCEDAEFYPRMATRSFPVLEYRKAIPMPKKFVILVDISGSMKRELRDGYTRGEYAQATAIALAEQAEAGNNQCEVIFFNGKAHRDNKLVGTPRQIQEALFAQGFKGGSTNFEDAFRAADETNADSVVIVTDGGSAFTKPPRTPLMTLIIGRDVDSDSEGIRALEQVSYRLEVVA